MAKPSRMRLKIDWWVKGKSRPRVVNGWRLTSVFAAWRQDRTDSWRVTHIPTGYRAQSALGSSLWTLRQAQQYAQGLERRFGKRAWKFTDPTEVVDKAQWKGAGKVCREIAARVTAAAS